MTKMKKEEMELNEEDLKRIQQRLDDEQLSLDNAKVTRDFLKAQVELDLPRRQTLAQLRQLESEVSRMEGNVKVYQKQIKTKKIIRLVPES